MRRLKRIDGEHILNIVEHNLIEDLKIRLHLSVKINEDVPLGY